MSQLLPDEDDPAKPFIWYRMRTQAVVSMRAGNVRPAQEYCRFVEKHRDRETAKKAMASIVAAARIPVEIKRRPITQKRR